LPHNRDQRSLREVALKAQPDSRRARKAGGLYGIGIPDADSDLFLGDEGKLQLATHVVGEDDLHTPTIASSRARGTRKGCPLCATLPSAAHTTCARGEQRAPDLHGPYRAIT